MNEVGKIIEKYGLKPLPGEGGYYKETYRSKEIIAPSGLGQDYSGARNLSTSILYLVTPQHFSRLHRLISDEVFHFYKGDPVYMLNLFEDGTAQEIILGQNIEAGQKVQHMVPKYTWQGACLLEGGSYALLGTTVSPGFDFADYQDYKGKESELIEKYSQYQPQIEMLI